MKVLRCSLFPSLLLGLSLALPNLSPAQDGPPGTMVDVKLLLTLVTDAPGTLARDEDGELQKSRDGKPIPSFGGEWTIRKDNKVVQTVAEEVSKLVTSKYGNKEFLLDLVTYGVIEDIKGWSLKVVQATRSDELDPQIVYSGEEMYFLVHSDPERRGPIGLNAILNFDRDNTQAAVTFRDTVKFDAAEQPASRTIVYNESVRRQIELNLNFHNVAPELPEYRFELEGLYSGGESLKLIGPAKQAVIMAAAGKMYNIAGRRSYADFATETFTSHVVDGTILYSSGKYLPDVTEYEDAYER